MTLWGWVLICAARNANRNTSAKGHTHAEFAVEPIWTQSPDKQIEAYRSKVDAINALEAEMEALSDEDLAAKTATFKQQLANGARLEELMVPAFAVVREGGKRSLGLRMFDVQLIGAMVLFEGKIAEMKTGEGKTLTATAAAYLRSLEGQGVHVVTVNDYLAARDTREMAPLFHALGVSVSCVTPRMGLSDEQLQTPGMLDAVKRYAYDQDVTYTIASEIGFDFMRDHMKPTQEQKVQQRGLSYAIVDEVDSVLVDEARMPLSISGAPVDVSHQFNAINSIVPKLSEDAYEIDEKARSLKLTETGAVELEELLKSAGLLPAGTTLYDPENVTLLHNSQASLQAHKLFHNGKDYIMANGEVVLINTRLVDPCQVAAWVVVFSKGWKPRKERRLGLKAQLLAQSRSKICSERTKKSLV